MTTPLGVAVVSAENATHLPDQQKRELWSEDVGGER
jgi:hypothetical protein